MQSRKKSGHLLATGSAYGAHWPSPSNTHGPIGESSAKHRLGSHGVGVGALVGIAVGLEVGDIVGSAVGTPVGDADGVADGDAVGLADGDAVGVPDGIAVG